MAGRMLQPCQRWDRDRIRSVLAVVVIHALAASVLLAGSGDGPLRRDRENRLRLFEVAPEPPPPPLPEPVPAEVKSEVEEGAAAPPGLKAQPVPVVVVPPKVRLPLPPPPVVAAPVAGVGVAPSAGSSEIAGPGPGAGGVGNGTGSGRSGDGAGGGGAVTRARLVGGRMVHKDYPDAAGDVGAEGTVVVRLNVGSDGRASRCRVTSSSGNADLDATTCRLAEQRFRYAPARNARGEAIADVAGWSQDWWIGNRGGR